MTQANVGRRFAVVLDDKYITAPVIREPILGGSGQIEGNFTVESAQNLSVLLRAGALPADLTIVEERTVGPSLGAGFDPRRRHRLGRGARRRRRLHDRLLRHPRLLRRHRA